MEKPTESSVGDLVALAQNLITERPPPWFRLQVWGGEISKTGTLVPQDLPSFVTDFPNLLEKLKSTGAFSATPQGTANHIILNEYLPGQGITPHQDGAAYHPVVATLTLGSHAVMDYYQYREPPQITTDGLTKKSQGENSGRVIDSVPILRLLLEPRSLVITHGVLYTQHLHGISGTRYDIFAPSHVDQDILKTKYAGEGDTVQIVSAQDIANRGILGSQVLRDHLAQLTSSNGSLDQAGEEFRLERLTRASLTCRVVEKTSKAAGKLLKLR
ncbi:unnamed protein product [Rhizoctonia solani]|uniref:Fe2OG dioxygenase domain-containing protein n=1 Tax=Rhizoctonia solani TaxID=456999 RepID=A0A8H3CAR9_9AGAM|nr:unnamed protein product [Rhizoctonia solani]